MKKIIRCSEIELDKCLFREMGPDFVELTNEILESRKVKWMIEGAFSELIISLDHIVMGTKTAAKKLAVQGLKSSKDLFEKDVRINLKYRYAQYLEKLSRIPPLAKKRSINALKYFMNHLKETIELVKKKYIKAFMNQALKSSDLPETLKAYWQLFLGGTFFPSKELFVTE